MADDKVTADTDGAKKLVGWSIQAVLAIGIIVAVYYVSLYCSMQDSLVQVTYGTRSRVKVAPGVIPPNTVLGTDKRMTLSGRPIEHLPQSKHQRGGIQFSYSFWMKVPEPSHGAFRKVVLLRGDPTPGDFAFEGQTFKMPVSFCPMVLVTRNADLDVTVSLHLNTDKELNFSSVQSVPNGDSPVNFMQWNLITVSAVDAFGYGSETETSLSCSVWVNQVEYKTVAPTSFGGIRLNSGNLYLLPTGAMGVVGNGAVDGLQIRDLEYTNYVMSTQDIYDKIAAESDKAAVPYQMRNTTSGTQAFYDISMAHLSVK